MHCLEVFQSRPICKHDDLVLITDLEPGAHQIAGETVQVGKRAATYFVSRNSGHPTVAEFEAQDFFMPYSRETDAIEYMTNKEFEASGFTPILLSRGEKSPKMVAGIKEFEGKFYVISFVKNLPENPVLQRYMANLYDYTRKA